MDYPCGFSKTRSQQDLHNYTFQARPNCLKESTFMLQKLVQESKQEVLTLQNMTSSHKSNENKFSNPNFVKDIRQKNDANSLKIKNQQIKFLEEQYQEEQENLKNTINDQNTLILDLQKQNMMLKQKLSQKEKQEYLLDSYKNSLKKNEISNEILQQSNQSYQEKIIYLQEQQEKMQEKNNELLKQIAKFQNIQQRQNELNQKDISSLQEAQKIIQDQKKEIIIQTKQNQTLKLQISKQKDFFYDYDEQLKNFVQNTFLEYQKIETKLQNMVLKIKKLQDKKQDFIKLKDFYNKIKVCLQKYQNQNVFQIQKQIELKESFKRRYFELELKMQKMSNAIYMLTGQDPKLDFFQHTDQINTLLKDQQMQIKELITKVQMGELQLKQKQQQIDISNKEIGNIQNYLERNQKYKNSLEKKLQMYQNQNTDDLMNQNQELKQDIQILTKDFMILIDQIKILKERQEELQQQQSISLLENKHLENQLKQSNFKNQMLQEEILGVKKSKCD